LPAFDLAAEQGARRRAENGAGGPLTLSIDGAARQRAGGGADDQAGRAVGALAVIAPVVTAPVLNAVGRLVHTRLLGPLAMSRRPAGRIGRGRHCRYRE